MKKIELWGEDMQSCIFCQIISRKADAYIIYENENVCCFLDKFPINKGHILIVPKIHYPEFSNVDKESLSAVIHAGQKVTKALESILDTDGITILQDNGVFKDVEHYHMHIIPRYKDDGFSWIEPSNKMTSADFIDVSVRLQDYFH